MVIFPQYDDVTIFFGSTIKQGTHPSSTLAQACLTSEF
jgi:hypothetical protein